jgi:choline/glycine/proline betaine transport protein
MRSRTRHHGPTEHFTIVNAGRELSGNDKGKARALINAPVFFGSASLILVFVVLTATFPEAAGNLFARLQLALVHGFGWFYLLAVAVFIVFVLALALSDYGRIRLGPDHAEPDYSYGSWFAMLFSAGMGIGLLFFGVAEPITHYMAPPAGDPHTIAAARQAMSITFFHWGIHAWAIYAVVGLSLAYFSFRHGLPLTIRSALFPLIGDRIRGPIGHAVDIFAVLGTMFGVATSLGLGVLQVNSGLDYLLGWEPSIALQLGLIAGITLIATGSVVAGLDAGIRRLSELNLLLALVLLLYVLFAGPTLHLLQALVQNLGIYLAEVVPRTFNLYAYSPNEWLGTWTLFYWGWWISWSPFVGMFIARISRGRTIREFVIGVLFVPVGFTFVWMTFFGNTAIFVDSRDATWLISQAVGDDVSVAIFKLFEQLPLTQMAATVATLLVVTFFVTSSDSGSLVIDTITSGGEGEAPVWQRIFWALGEGVVAAVLLVAGGLTALQTAAIAGALPFTVVMLFTCFGLLRGLQMERLREVAHASLPPLPAVSARIPWQQRLRRIVSLPDQPTVQQFIATTAREALEEVGRELRELGSTADVEQDEDAVRLTVRHGSAPPFEYAIEGHAYRLPAFAVSEVEHEESTEPRYYRAEVHGSSGSQHHDVMGYTREQLIGDVLARYEKHMQFLHYAG